MRVSSQCRRAWTILLLCCVIAAGGCSRTRYRLQADQEAYDTIAERNFDPRWQAHDYSIEIDPRSRFFDAYDPDHPPMPPDDPASHQYMHRVDGKKGWKHWHKYGERIELENPAWRDALAEYVDVAEDGSVKLDIDSAIRLAYVHSPNHQQQLETLYLSSLDVAAQRFRLDTQFFGGYDARYVHNGSLVAPGLTYSPILRRFVFTPALDVDGAEVSRLTTGRGLPLGGPAISASRRFATAGELLVGFANSFVFEFTGGDANFATSLANFSFIQPLLRGAGKDVALEDLTFEERKLLANLRAYGQFRQGFYTQVAIGELGVTGPQRFTSNTNLQSFSGQEGIGGYLDLLQQRQRIRNSEDNLSLQERTSARLQALYENDLTTLVQVYQFRQSVENQRSQLLIDRNRLKLALDRYKTGTLGLPPDLPIELDESLIGPFQLIPREATRVQDSILELQRRIGEIAELLDLSGKVAELQNRLGGLPDDATVAQVRRLLTDMLRTAEAVQLRLDDLPADVARLDGAARDPTSDDVQTELMQRVKEQLREGPKDLADQFKSAKLKLQALHDGLSEATKETAIGDNVAWLKEFLRLNQGCLLVQSRARRLEGEPVQVLAGISELIEPVRQLFEGAQQDLARMEAVALTREQTMTDKEKELFRIERERLRKLFADLSQGERGFDVVAAKLEILRGGVSTRTRRETARGLVSWVQEFLQVVQRLVLVPAQARLEAIIVDSIDLGPEDALHVALANRLDFMNGRAALVDRWRLVQVNADALQSVVNVTAGGEIRTARNNPVSFRAPTGTLRMGMEFDAPFTRLLERNAYRESLIDYQQSRRGFIQSRDALNLGIRALIRNLEQLRQNLEIQRRAVTIAMRRVDQTQLGLNPPRQPVQPGLRPPIDPTLAINLLGAQTALRDTQNNFLGVWLNYFATRMRLYRELGIMTLDPDGRWREYPIGGASGAANGQHAPEEELVPLPPLVPAVWIEALHEADQGQTDLPANTVEQASFSPAMPPPRMQRLPRPEQPADTNRYSSSRDD